MAKISVALTTEGKEVLVAVSPQSPMELMTDFKDFSDREAFDALLALEYLTLRETRRGISDQLWVSSIFETHAFLEKKVGWTGIKRWKAVLGIDSAFAARDYGRKRVHTHFRNFTTSP